MPLQRGAMLGPYAIEGLVGKGGMGEVYRAHDARLGRTVAIKCITRTLADSAEMQRRFEDECRVSATLDHPRICMVHDVGRTDGVLYLVMEHLDGESLARRIERGPLPVALVLGYSIEIAAAMHYAHRRGVIHRDLKPANVFITDTGIKVLDFGLAKLRQVDQTPGLDVAGLNTVPLPTADGTIVGTAPYLSPERLEGKAADHRSDIFAFGTLLYEMLAGRRPFAGATPAALIAAVLTSNPPPLPPDPARPPALDWIVKRCLAKDPNDRWQSFGDVEAVLKWVARESSALPEAHERAFWRRESWRAWLTAALLLLTVAALGIMGWPPRTSASDGLEAFVIPPPPGARFRATDSSVQSPQLAVCPDGRTIALVATDADGISRLWTRGIASTAARPLGGTEDASYPFWSPDCGSVGFFADGSLKRVDLAGGPARVLAPAPSGRGGTWSTTGTILFAPRSDGLHLISADGTGLRRQTTLEKARGDSFHRWPHFLPDGRRFIWFVRSDEPDAQGVYLGSLDSAASTLLVRSNSSAQYVPSGQLLYLSEGALLARDLDLRRATLSGDPILIAEQVAAASNFYSAFSASDNGVVAYGSSATAGELIWFSRQGLRLGSAGARGRYVDFQLSPDGSHVAVAAVDSQSDRTDINILELARGVATRLTSVPDTDASPVWSPDGAHVLFRSNRRRVHDLYTRPASASGAEDLVLSTPVSKYPTDWTRGGHIFYHAEMPDTGWDIWSIPWSPPRQPRAVVRTENNEVQGQVSPDGAWLAYAAEESSRYEVYVQRLDVPGRRWRVSINGGADPKWRADGRELFFIGADGALMAVAFDTRSAGDPNARQERLFSIPFASVAAPYMTHYEPANDGRFLVRVREHDVQTLPINVLVHWRPRRTTGH